MITLIMNARDTILRIHQRIIMIKDHIKLSEKVIKTYKLYLVMHVTDKIFIDEECVTL